MGRLEVKRSPTARHGAPEGELRDPFTDFTCKTVQEVYLGSGEDGIGAAATGSATFTWDGRAVWTPAPRLTLTTVVHPHNLLAYNSAAANSGIKLSMDLNSYKV